jgi:inorganic pyrophosphatase
MAKRKEEGSIDVVIETPKGCRNKYAWDEENKAFRLKKILPAGAVFPFDFGFIPNTKGEDGDPIDVLVIMDEPAFPGCVVECRIIGVLKAKQTERDGDVAQNDRFIGVSVLSELYKGFKEINAMHKNVLDEIEHFFISYNQIAGKKFEPQGWADASEAKKLIRKSSK